MDSVENNLDVEKSETGAMVDGLEAPGPEGPYRKRTHRCLHEYFELQAVQAPDALALEFGHEYLTYGKLNYHANRVAYFLEKRGIEPEDKVCTCFRRSMEMAIFMLAVAKAGACIVPLDPEVPRERQIPIIQKIGAAVLVFSPRYGDRFDEFDIPRVAVDMDMIEQLPDQVRDPPLQPDHRRAAFIAFSSGSTGVPKGVVIEHGGACSTLEDCLPFFEITPSSRILGFSNYTFDVSYSEMWLALSSGACLCILNEKERVDDLAGSIKHMRITQAILPPTVVGLINPQQVTTLKTLAFAGEQIWPSLIDTWVTRVRLLNYYGPCEADLVTAVKLIDATQSNANIIGRPTGCQVFIADPQDYNKLAPRGATGEIIIRGPAVGRHYIGDQMLSSKSFVNPPSWVKNSIDGEKLYRSGDLAYYLPNDDICYVGRRDNQVKFHGRRIELDEIGHHLRQCKGISRAVVTLIERSGNQLLTAFVTMDAELPENRLLKLTRFDCSIPSGTRTVISSVREQLAQKLPAPMLPSLIIPFAEYPLMPSGKVNRRLMCQLVENATPDTFRNMCLNDGPDDAQNTTSRSSLEKHMCALWADVLHLEADTIKTSDNFFHLGGTSFAAIRLVQKAPARGFALSVATITLHPTFSSMVEHAGKLAQQTGLKAAEPPAQTSYRALLLADHPEGIWEQVHPTTAAQKWGLLRGTDWPEPYYAHLIIELKGRLDKLRLRSSCRAVISQTPILRTVFYLHNGLCLQAVTPSEDVDIDIREFGSLDEAEAFWKSENNNDNFLGRTLTQLSLVHIEDKCSWFSIGLHHAQFDEWTIPLLVDEMRAAYEGRLLRKRPSFIEYTQSVEQRMNDQAFEFWRNYLNGSIMTQVSSRVQGSGGPDGFCHRRIPKLPGRTDVDFAAALHASWAMMLAKRTRSADVVFLTVASGRRIDFEGVADVMGDCPNVIPVRYKISLQSRYADLLDAFHTEQPSLLSYETTPFQIVVEKSTTWSFPLTIGSIINHTVGEEVSADAASTDPQDLSWKYLRMEAREGRCEGCQLYLRSTITGSSVSLSMVHNPVILDKEDVVGLMDDICHTIRKIYEDPTSEVPNFLGLSDVSTG